MHVKRSSRSIRAGAVAIALVGSALVAGGMPAAAVASTPTATAVFTTTPQLDGVVKVRPGDAGKDPAAVATTVDGVQCWQMKDDPYVRYLYVDVDQSRIPQGATRALVTVDYYDAGDKGFDIHYDSKTSPWTGSRNQQLTGTNTWKHTTFELTNINFANRSNGYDFRLNVKANQGEMPPVCFSKVSVAFTDQPVAAIDSLAIMSPSLIFKKGETSVKVATPASQVTWRLGDADDVQLRTGTTPVSGGEGAIDLKDLPFGYYTLNVTANVPDPVTRTTSLAVLDAPPAGWNAKSALFGTQLHRGWQSPAETEALLDAITLAGYGKTRNETTWGEVEAQKGVYAYTGEGARVVTELANRGVNVMWNAGLTNPLYDDNHTPASPEAIAGFAAYVGATAAHYGGQGVSHDIGILNEYNSTGFNNGTCGLTAACYLDVLRPAYQAAHAADAKANVIAPITAGVQLPWAKDFIAKGGLDHIDTYAVNYYSSSANGQPMAPEKSQGLADLGELSTLLAQSQGGKDIPLRVTESGWATHDAGVSQKDQADYAIRGPLLAQLAGADEYLWYDLYDDGFSDNERENRFGLINRADDTACWLWVCPTADYTYGAVHGISPKPGFVTQAVAIRQTTGLTLSGRESIGGDTLYSLKYAGATAADTNRAMWSIGADSVTVSSKKGFTVTDEFGRVTQVAKGDTTIALTGAPVFVRGDVTVKAAAPQLVVDVPKSSVLSHDLPVTVKLAPGAKIKGGELTVSADGVKKKVKLKKGTTVSLTLPGVTRLGARDVTVTVADKKGRLLSQARGKTNVVDPYVVSAQPRVEKGTGGLAYSLDVTVKNNAADVAVDVDGMDWKLGTASGTVTDAFTVPASGSKTVSVPIADPKVFATQNYTVSARSGDLVRSASGPLSFAPIERTGAATLAPIDLDTAGKWVSIRNGGRNGAADLGGTLQFTATADALTLKAVITDDVHQADRTDPALSWQADSIQFNTYDLFPTVLGGERVEIAAALLKTGPVVYTFTPPAGGKAGITPGAEATIVRDEVAHTTTYDVTVPWASLGYDAAPKGVWGLSFLVNDADNDVAGADARSGYIEWGSGVGGAPKNPALFKSVQLVGIE
ncbi:hypothetical protein [Microbacterium sp.]|uniref:hypothetical protein n=1 Tax=Microbacterium sp. TaxID=51671 RepID=UPI00333F52B8